MCNKNDLFGVFLEAVAPPALVLSLFFLLTACATGSPTGQWDCLNDRDCDGFIDVIEAQGYTSYCGNFHGTSDSTKQTLFYFHVIDMGANTPFNPTVPLDAASRLDYLETDRPAPDKGGLNLDAAHLIQFTEANGDPDNLIYYRRVTPESLQKGILLREDTYETWPESEVLGVAGYGIPENSIEATIFTNVIRTLINSECGEGFAESPAGDINVCRNYVVDPEEPKTGLALFQDLARHVYAHEAAHMLRPLAAVTQREYERYGYHTATGTGYVLDVSVEYKYSNKDGWTTFYIFNDFRDIDYNAIKLVR
ncbi:MAG: hypothetical protein JXR72_04325 [Proteobacteria bacterium]|nr:hypothetical protein [Pseudomonadota bacterium]